MVRHVFITNCDDFLGRKLAEEFIYTGLEVYTFTKSTYISHGIQEKVHIVDEEAFSANSYRHKQFDLVIWNLCSQGKESYKNDLCKNFLVKCRKEKSYFLLIHPLQDGAKQKTDSLYFFVRDKIHEEDQKAGIISLGEVYGPGMELMSSTVFTRYLKQTLRKRTVILSGKETFTYYIYIDDAVKGIMQACHEQYASIYLLANKTDISLSSLAIRLSELTGTIFKDKLTQHTEDRLKNLPHILPGWQPQVTIEEGLEKTIQWLLAQTQVKRRKNIQLVSIASLHKPSPIRNYTPPAAFKDPEPVKETVVPIYTLHTKRKVAHANDIEISNIETGQQRTSINMPHKLQIMVLLVLGAVYFFVLCPLILIGINYTLIQFNVRFSHTQAAAGDAQRLVSAIQSTRWIFTVTHLTSLYSRLSVPADNIYSYLILQDTVQAYTAPLLQFKTDLTKQSDLTPVLVQMEQEPDTASWKAALESIDPSTISLFLPESQSIKGLHDSLYKAALASEAYKTLPILFRGNRQILLAIADKSETRSSVYTQSMIQEIYAISVQNGMMKNVAVLQPSGNISTADFTDFANKLQTEYNMSNGTFILIDRKAFSSIKTASSGSDGQVRTMTKDVLTQKDLHRELLADMEKGMVQTYTPGIDNRFTYNLFLYLFS